MRLLCMRVAGPKGPEDGNCRFIAAPPRPASSFRLIDALERQFSGDGGTGFVVRDHYVARLLTLLELLSSAYRVAKP
jgi:hypothetical protein